MHALHDVTEAWKAGGADVDTVEPILRFMEEHPGLDYGTPGPLVHFMEAFYRAGYEERLLASIDRRPIQHTVWMMNRLINGAKEPAERQRLLEKLESVLIHPRADSETIRHAKKFLEHQRR